MNKCGKIRRWATVLLLLVLMAALAVSASALYTMERLRERLMEMDMYNEEGLRMLRDACGITQEEYEELSRMLAEESQNTTSPENPDETTEDPSISSGETPDGTPDGDGGAASDGEETGTSSGGETDDWFRVEDMEELISQKIIPIVVFAVTSIGAVYVAIAPVLNRMRRASGNMDSASGGINAQAKASREAVEKIEAFRGEVEKTVQELEAVIQKTLAENRENFQAMQDIAQRRLDECQAYIEQVRQNVGRVETMLTVGFGNSDELVRKGYAKVIFDLRDGSTDIDYGMLEAPGSAENSGTPAHGASDASDTSEATEGSGEVTGSEEGDGYEG